MRPELRDEALNAPLDAAASIPTDADLERRFGGLRRLYGDTLYACIRAAHVVVVGVGGVGSWAAEALARSGVAALTLIDLDQVSESNINRQIQALASTVGQAKVDALRERVADIHPACEVVAIEEFVEPDNWPALLARVARPVDVVIDACDQGRAKAVLAAWALATSTPLVIVGAAGGKRKAEAVAVEDLGLVTHDPMLASLRQRLRRHHGAGGGRIGLRCVYSREPVQAPLGVDLCNVDGGLNCHGYGSSVAVTATFGMVAAGVAIESLGVSSSRAGTPGRI